MKSNVEFMEMPLGKETIYLTPDAVLVLARDAVARYSDVQVHCKQVRFIEDAAAPGDATIVGETWRYVNRKGGPDRRFNNNRKLPICLYGEIEFNSESGLKERLNCSRVDVSEEFVSAFAAIRNTEAAPAGVSPPALPSGVNGQEDPGLDVGAAYRGETELARSLVRDRDRYWEFLLVQELLRSRLEPLKHDCAHIGDLLKKAPKRPISGAEFASWIGEQLPNLSAAIASMTTYINRDLMDALGEPGVPGDPLKILRTIDSLLRQCRCILDFELALSAAVLPAQFRKLQSAFRGIALSVAGVLEDMEVRWAENTEGVRNGSKKFELTVTFEPPPQLQAVSEEMEKIMSRR